MIRMEQTTLNAEHQDISLIYATNSAPVLSLRKLFCAIFEDKLPGYL